MIGKSFNICVICNAYSTVPHGVENVFNIHFEPTLSP